jgi:hypothetical protein
MATSRQSQDMDAKQVAERHLIEGYLAGQLSEAEADAFESLVASHPELAMQIEHVARMKVGLDVLRRRGELAPLLLQRSRLRYRLPWVAAAAAASVALVAFVLLQLAPPSSDMIATTLGELGGKHSQPWRIAATYLLTSDRAAAPPAQIGVFGGDGDAIELRFDVAAGMGDRFAIEIFRAEGDSLESIAHADKVLGSADGSVVVYLAARALAPGSYLFRLTPADGGIPLEFAARIDGR